MDNKLSNNSHLMQEAMKIAATPEGKKLINLLQQQNGNDLQKAMNLAAEGDISQARKVIQSLMENPDAKKLLDQLGR